MTSDEVFRAELQLYTRPPEPAPPSFVDLELAAQLGGARLLFTNRFITDVLVGPLQARRPLTPALLHYL